MFKIYYRNSSLATIDNEKLFPDIMLDNKRRDETLQDKHTEPHWDTSALVTIDMQNCFISPKIGKKETKAHSIVANIVGLLDIYRAKGKPIVQVVRSYLPDGSDADVYRKGIIERGEFSLAPGSDEAELVAALKPGGSPALDFDILRNGEFQKLGPNEWAMYKSRLGAFYKTGFEGWLREKCIDTVVFVGTFFPNCVRQSVTEANERDFRTVVVTDAIFGIHDTGEKELKAIGVACMEIDKILGLI